MAHETEVDLIQICDISPEIVECNWRDCLISKWYFYKHEQD